MRKTGETRVWRMGGEDGDGIGNILSFIFVSYFSII